MLLRPFPWQPAPTSALRLAQLEMVIWYPLLLLAAFGLIAVRRSAHVLLFPLLVGAGSAAMWALVEGNFGTAYRHRGEFVWVVALLAAAGAADLRRWQLQRRYRGTPAPEPVVAVGNAERGDEKA
jgi:hypothetical protein